MLALLPIRRSFVAIFLCFLIAVLSTDVSLSFRDESQTVSLHDAELRGNRSAVAFAVQGSKAEMASWFDLMHVLYGSDAAFEHEVHFYLLTYDESLDTEECAQISVASPENRGLHVHCIFHPGTSWTAGRNELARGIALNEERVLAGLQYKYWVMADQDIIESQCGRGCTTTACCFTKLISMLLSPRVNYALVGCAGYRPPSEQALIHDEQEMLLYEDCQDAMMQAFHRDAVPILLPYIETLDFSSWWEAQILNYHMIAHCIPGASVIYPFFQCSNGAHSEYPRGKSVVYEKLALTRLAESAPEYAAALSLILSRFHFLDLGDCVRHKKGWENISEALVYPALGGGTAEEGGSVGMGDPLTRAGEALREGKSGGERERKGETDGEKEEETENDDYWYERGHEIEVERKLKAEAEAEGGRGKVKVKGEGVETRNRKLRDKRKRRIRRDRRGLSAIEEQTGSDQSYRPRFPPHHNSSYGRSSSINITSEASSSSSKNNSRDSSRNGYADGSHVLSPGIKVCKNKTGVPKIHTRSRKLVNIEKKQLFGGDWQGSESYQICFSSLRHRFHAHITSRSSSSSNAVEILHRHWPPDGTALMSASPTAQAIFLMFQGQKLHIPDMDTFFALNFNIHQIRRVEESLLSEIPDGEAIISVDAE